MSRLPRIAIAVALALAGCEPGDSVGPESAGLALHISPQAGAGEARLDEVIVWLQRQGDQPRSYRFAPGVTDTITGLTPGTYTVAIEGMVGGGVDLYGQTSVQVVAGQDRAVSITVGSFVPQVQSISQNAEAGKPITVTFTAVGHAQNYDVEWAADASFANPQTQSTPSTSTAITAAEPGTYYVRVRARTPFQSIGRAGTPADVVVGRASQRLTVAGAGGGRGTVTSTPEGISCQIVAGGRSGTCETEFAFGTSVALRAEPAAGSVLTGWAGAGCASGVCTVVMDQARSVTATFEERPSHLLQINGGGTGRGRVTSQPGGIDCGVQAGATSGDCSEPFEVATAVTLTAIPEPGSGFVRWEGVNCSTAICSVTMNQPVSARAVFDEAPAEYTLTISAFGPGRVTSNLPGVECAGSSNNSSATICTFMVDAGEVVTLQPLNDYYFWQYFIQWSDDCAGVGRLFAAGPSCAITMIRDHIVGAQFDYGCAADQVFIGDASGTVDIPVRMACGARSYGHELLVTIDGATICTIDMPASVAVFQGTCRFDTTTYPDGNFYRLTIHSYGVVGGQRVTWREAEGGINIDNVAQPPQIFNLGTSVGVINGCNGTSTAITGTFSYNDPDGDIPAVVQLEYYYEYNPNRKGTLTATPTRNGNGYAGTLSYSYCHVFGSDTQISETVRIMDAEGIWSNSLTVVTPRPPGAN